MKRAINTRSPKISVATQVKKFKNTLLKILIRMYQFS